MIMEGYMKLIVVVIGSSRGQSVSTGPFKAGSASHHLFMRNPVGERGAVGSMPTSCYCSSSASIARFVLTMLRVTRIVMTAAAAIRTAEIGRVKKVVISP